MKDPKNEIIKKLREDTSALHLQIENTRFVKKLSQRTLPEVCVLDQLRAFAIIHSSVERMLADINDPRVCSLVEVYSPRAQHLLQDLQTWDRIKFIGDNGYAIRLARKTADEIMLIRERSEIALLGVLYVLEGTLLGNLTHQEDVAVCCANLSFTSTYYEGYGASTISYWKRFCETLSAISLEQEEVVAVVNAAVIVFLHFDWIFSSLCPPPEKRIFLATTFNPEAGNHPVPQNLAMIHAAQLASETCLRMYPYFLVRFGERGRSFSLSDALWVSAIFELDFPLLAEQIDWLIAFLSRKGIPSVTMETLLEILAKELLAVSETHAQGAQNLQALAKDLRQKRCAVIDEARTATLILQFEEAGTHCKGETFDNAAILLLSAYVDEQNGIEGALEAMTVEMLNPEKFDTVWIDAASHLLSGLQSIDKKQISVSK